MWSCAQYLAGAQSAVEVPVWGCRAGVGRAAGRAGDRVSAVWGLLSPASPPPSSVPQALGRAHGSSPSERLPRGIADTVHGSAFSPPSWHLTADWRLVDVVVMHLHLHYFIREAKQESGIFYLLHWQPGWAGKKPGALPRSPTRVQGPST